MEIIYQISISRIYENPLSILILFKSGEFEKAF